MELEQILIRKEEIPIYEVLTGTGPKPYFQLPIHPIFASDEIRLDEGLAQRLFPKILGDWHIELKAHADGLPEGDTKNWFYSVFLDGKPYIEKKYGSQYIGPRKIWRDDVGFLKNGFAFYFSLERDMAGSIGVHFGDFDGIRKYIGPRQVKFTPEKFAEYDADRDLKKKITKKQIREAKDGVSAYVFGHHNVELYASALFLRDWAIMYENEALKSLRKSGSI